MISANPTRNRLALSALAFALVALVLWQRWPTFGFRLWNVDEAIHAAAARTILDGGVLYRDAIDQRTPLTYYAVAGIFALCGENNLWAVRCAVALLIAATAFLLGLAGWRLRGPAAGITAAVLYALLSSSVLFAGDAYAAGTEWFVAFFSSAAAVVFLRGATTPSPRRLFCTGLLYAGAFLSKQPALLDLAAPVAALAYLAWRQAGKIRPVLFPFSALAAGWLAPVLATAGYFAARGALRDGIFYAWTYNVACYGPEITTADRLGSLAVPFQLIGGSQPWLLALWAAGGLGLLHRLMQRHPTPDETTGNPAGVFVAGWSLAGLAGAAAGGRGYDHYSIQFLAPFCLGAGLALAWLFDRMRAGTGRWLGRVSGGLLLAAVAYGAGTAALAARKRTVPADPSLRVSAYIREQSAAADRIFVWGYHPDIYLYADRRPASRFLYASFLTGLIPWTNTAPERDTAYAIVPGAMETLLRDLSARPPVFIVDCSAGPNRHWQKYPLEKFPALQDYVTRHYEVTEGGRFVPQGFRLYRLMSPAQQAARAAGPPDLPAAIVSTLKIGTVTSGLAPLRASAPNGVNLSMTDGRQELFAHAPSSLVYRIPAGTGALRGGFGIRAGAYAPDNKGPTDGAEFIIRWRPAGGPERVLLRRLLRPREQPADRPVQSFRVEWEPGTGGELELAIGPGPADNNASDWTFWTDLLLETFP